ncbi:hypothetical protein BDR22DRAFT_876913 [Usnea florida]
MPVYTHTTYLSLSGNKLTRTFRRDLINSFIRPHASFPDSFSLSTIPMTISNKTDIVENRGSEKLGL